MVVFIIDPVHYKQYDVAALSFASFCMSSLVYGLQAADSQKKCVGMSSLICIILQAADAQKKVHDGANVGAVVLVPMIDEEEKAIEEAKQKAEAEKAERATRRSFRRVNIPFSV